MLNRRLRRDEEGSTLVIAMMVMMILATLSTAVLARTLSSLKAIRHGQDYDAALAAADAGLSDALYKIDQTAPATWTATGTAGVGRYDYKAIKRSETEYEIRSIGSVDQSKHGVRAKVTRTAKYPFVLFSNQDLTFDGNSTFNVYSYLILGGPSTGQANVGSNGKIVVNSGKGAGDAQHYFAPSGGCSGCPTPIEHKEGPYVLEAVVEPVGSSPCPDTLGVITGVVTGGTYVCRKDITFSGNVSVAANTGAFILYLLPTTGASPRDSALDISAAFINVTGKSRNFQIHKAGSAPLLVGAGNTSATLTFNGIMYAPQTTVTINGGKYFNGSWTVNKLVVNGGPNIKIGYDLDLETYLGVDWTVSKYAEVPSGSIPLT
jgi:hypothetical protein